MVAQLENRRESPLTSFNFSPLSLRELTYLQIQESHRGDLFVTAFCLLSNYLNCAIVVYDGINLFLKTFIVVLEQSSGCIGCNVRPKLNSSLDDPFRGHENHALTKSQASLSEDFGTSSACEVDNAPKQSCGSISFTSALPQAQDVHGAVCSSNPSEFVNHGLILWNESRQKWKGNKEPESGPKQLPEPKLSWNATYDSLLSCNKPFQQPIPLAEMVDFLVDIWEQEGMYD